MCQPQTRKARAGAIRFFARLPNFAHLAAVKCRLGGGRLQFQHGDTTLWVAFPVGSRRGDEPVLAAWDVATGREVWKSENLLR